MVSRERTYRAVINGSAFEVRVDGSIVTVDDEHAAVSFVRSRTHDYSLIVNGRSLDLAVEALDDDTVRVTHAGSRTEVKVLDRAALLLERLGIDRGRDKHEQEIRAPMPGLVVAVLVELNQHIEAGQGVVVLEAMKMENQLVAVTNSVVSSIHVQPGDAVTKNALLVSCDPVVPRR
jgi:pyruvate carboxylase subunit B